MTARPRKYDRRAEELRTDEVSLAFPKRKFIPRDSSADDSALALPKEHPDRNRAYLDFVRSELCAVWGDDAKSCAGVTEAAHLEVFGKGIKASDFLTVPLCTAHHRQQHSVGIAQFQIEHATNLWEASTRLLVRWIRRMR